MGLFGELFIEKKFTQEEQVLIDEFVLDAANELDKAGFKVTFKPDRNTKAKPTPGDWSVTDIARYELFYQGKTINGDSSLEKQDLIFYKTLSWRAFGKNHQELFIRFSKNRDSMGETHWKNNIIFKNNNYSINPKEYFDDFQKDFVKITISFIKYWSNKVVKKINDDQTYIGELKNGKFHGKGTMYYKSGIMVVGIWEKGKLKKKTYTNEHEDFFRKLKPTKL